MAQNSLGTYKKSGIPVRQPGASSFGPTVFVDADNGNDDNLGTRPDRAVASIEKGVDIAALEGLDASVIVRRGFYQPAKVIALTSDHEGIRIVADRIMPVMAGSNHRIYNIGGPDDIFTINGADNVEIAGFRMWPEMSGTATGIDMGETAGNVGAWIHDNAFVNVEAANMATSVRMGSSSYELQYTLLENNLFHCGGTQNGASGIVDWTHTTRSMVRNNFFHIIGNNTTRYAIRISDALAPRGMILDNHFVGNEVGVAAMVCKAIYAPSAFGGGDFMISGNKAVNIATPYSDLGAEAFGLNYIGVTTVTLT